MTDPATWKFTTARSSFERVTCTAWWKCSGCGIGITAGQPMLERDYIERKKVTGKTRLHDNDECFETWEIKVLEKLAARREDRQKG